MMVLIAGVLRDDVLLAQSRPTETSAICPRRPRNDIPSPEQLVAVHISLIPFQDPDRCDTMRCVVLTPEGDYETPGVQHAPGRRGGCVAARGGRPAAGDAGDPVPTHRAPPPL